MPPPFKAVKLNDRVYWVGAIDWTMRDFHGYATRRGSTYNAYLILADKVTLIDTVKAPFVGEMMARVASVIEPEKIDYVISNHTEMDHSGGLPVVLDRVKPERFFASKLGAKALPEHFTLPCDITPVGEGETLTLGNRSVAFVETRMLHWPDSMFTYLVEDKLLFSSDAFGMHVASVERFADEIPESVLEYEGGKYFANILLLYAPLILKLIEKVKTLGIELATIAPDHGPIWRKDAGKIVGCYAKWAEQKPTRKAVIAYDTMWNSTGAMARAVEQGLVDGEATAKVMHLRADHRSDVVTEVLDAGALIVGSPTLNNGMFPTVAELLCYLKGLKPKHLIGSAFGSYGWSGEAVGQIAEELEGMQVALAADPVKAKYVPTDVDLQSCRNLGLAIAKALPAK